ncbi:hypothetical protein M408DRAFT_82038, partial [Serendipita vermifera MAFF 305830]
QSVVLDGITLGHPCCAVYNCKLPLPTNQSHYCEAHHTKERECSINGCSNAAKMGFKTCATGNMSCLGIQI